jgi:translation initiation factor 2 alpha subunit (eIF-2alpha)
MSNFQYYSIINPTVGELVLVTFTEKQDSFFRGNLIQYPSYNTIMNFFDASRKRKITSWNKIVPLDKIMVARVDDVDISKKTVNLSLAHLDDYVSGKNLSHTDIQTKLMEPFSKNKILEGLIQSLCVIHNYNFKTLWETLVHYIDIERRNYNDSIEEELCIWDYFTEKYTEKINFWCIESGIESEICENLMSLYTKRLQKSPTKITSLIKIISQEGVGSIRRLLSECLNTLSYNFTFNYTTAPNWIFETSSLDTSPDDHHELVKNLGEKIKELSLRAVFIQAPADTLGKICN